MDYKESWASKKWCFWTVVLEKTLESPLDCKEIQPVHPKGDQSWVFIGRTDAEAETLILWPHDAKNWLIWKDPDAGKDWRQEEKGKTEDEIVGSSPTRRTWVWASSGSSWWTGKPGVLQSVGLQGVGHDWVTELKDKQDSTVEKRNSGLSFYVFVKPWLNYLIKFLDSFHFTEDEEFWIRYTRYILFKIYFN